MKSRMAIPLIALGSLFLIVGMILALKSLKPTDFNVLAGLVIIIGTFFGLFGKQLQDKSSSEKSSNILETSIKTNEITNEIKKLELLNQVVTSNTQTLVAETQKLTSEHFKLTEQVKNIIDHTKKVVDNNLEVSVKTSGITDSLEILTKDLAALQRELNSEATGGESFPRASIKLFGNTEALLNIQNMGNYPLSDLSIMIGDVDYFSSFPSISYINLEKDITRFKLGNLSPGELNAYELTVSLILTGVERNITIHFQGKNASFVQFLKVRGFRIATIISKLQGNNWKKVFENIPDGFLKAGETTVNWKFFQDLDYIFYSKAIKIGFEKKN